jgi:hypothetical protein
LPARRGPVVPARVRWRQWEHQARPPAQARTVEAAAMRRPRAWEVLIALTAPVAVRVAKFAVVLLRAARGP